MRKRADNRGLTLTEILVALILLSGVGFTVLNSFISAAKLANPTPERYTALNLARENAEVLTEAVREDCFANPLLCPGINLDDTVSHTVAAKTIDAVTYTPTYEVNKVDADGVASNDDYRKVEMTVSW